MSHNTISNSISNNKQSYEFQTFKPAKNSTAHILHDNYISNPTNLKNPYRFPDVDGKDNIRLLKTQLDLLNDDLIQAESLKYSDVTIGGIFDVDAFNGYMNKIDTIKNNKHQLEEQILKERLRFDPIDINNLTLKQLKNGMIMDFVDMYIELKELKTINFENVSIIVNKKYRKITLLITIFLILLFSYLLSNLLSAKS